MDSNSLDVLEIVPAVYKVVRHRIYLCIDLFDPRFALIHLCSYRYPIFVSDFAIATTAEIKLQPANLSCYWNYNAAGVGQELYLSGCINGILLHRKEIHFEHAIKSVASNENFCLVLLDNGIACKVNLKTLQIVEINNTIIEKNRSLPATKKRPFSDTGSALQSKPNECITHLATGRSMTIAISSDNNVYNIPVKIWSFPKHVKVKKVCCGNEHCLILTTNGDVYSFGSSS